MSVIELEARYCLSDDRLGAYLTLSASLDLAEDEGEPMFVTFLHERFLAEAASYDFAHTLHLALMVHQGETLTVIARRAGRVVGSLVNEIDTNDGSRVLLHPKGGFNVLIYQQREESDAADTTADRLLASV